MCRTKLLFLLAIVGLSFGCDGKIEVPDSGKEPKGTSAVGAARLIGKTKDQVIAQLGPPVSCARCMWVGPELGASEEDSRKILDQTIDTRLDYPGFVVYLNVWGVVIAVSDK